MSIARIVDGHTRHEAIAEVNAILSRVRPPREGAVPFDGLRFGLPVFVTRWLRRFRTALVILAAAVGIVLLLACRTSRAFCWRGALRDSGRSPSVSRLAPLARASCARL